jgi:hypothetical protein
MEHIFSSNISQKKNALFNKKYEEVNDIKKKEN